MHNLYVREINLFSRDMVADWSAAPCVDWWEYWDADYGEDAGLQQHEVNRRVKEAKGLCHACPFEQECLDKALWEEATTVGRGKNHRFTVRGGMNPTEREAEHHRRGMVYLCVRCLEGERSPAHDLCVECVKATTGREYGKHRGRDMVA